MRAARPHVSRAARLRFLSGQRTRTPGAPRHGSSRPARFERGSPTASAAQRINVVVTQVSQPQSEVVLRQDRRRRWAVGLIERCSWIVKAFETNVNKLLQGAKVFIVPNFQRRYSWRLEEWQELWDDLLLESERVRSGDEAGQIEGHFLGSVVLHPASGPASTLMKHLVIDGQQRLTTILVLLAAIRDARKELDADWNPKSLTDQYLANPYSEADPLRLVPTRFDRADFASTIAGEEPRGAIGQAYEFFRDRLKQVAASPAALQRIADTLLINMVVVEINTSVGDSVNTIFNTLNSKGLPLTSTDLIRNELLLNLDDAGAEEAYERWWAPMERDLVTLGPRGKLNDRDLLSFFWAREVAKRPGTTKKNLFTSFEQSLREALRPLRAAERQEKVREAFEDIYLDHFAFLRVIGKSTVLDPHPPFSEALQEALDNLREWGSDTYLPIALWVSKEVLRDRLSDAEAVEMMRTTLGFLVRRALAGIPTNNLNRLLTPIPGQLDNDPSHASTILRQSLSRKGSYWPSDRDVREQLPSRPIYVSIKRNQVMFLLKNLERQLEPREVVQTEGLTIEHVMPSSLPPVWAEHLEDNGATVLEAEPLVHTIGNLTLTGYNSELSNSSFARKKALLMDSPLKLNREIASEDVWVTDTVRARSLEFARVLCAWLPGPDDAAASDLDTMVMRRDELMAALQAMPQGGWTTDEELSKLLGIELSDTRELIQNVSPVNSRLVRDAAGNVPTWLSPSVADQIKRQPSDDLREFLSAEDVARFSRDATEADGDSLESDNDQVVESAV